MNSEITYVQFVNCVENYIRNTGKSLALFRSLEPIFRGEVCKLSSVVIKKIHSFDYQVGYIKRLAPSYAAITPTLELFDQITKIFDETVQNLSGSQLPKIPNTFATELRKHENRLKQSENRIEAFNINDLLRLGLNNFTRDELFGFNFSQHHSKSISKLLNRIDKQHMGFFNPMNIAEHIESIEPRFYNLLSDAQLGEIEFQKVIQKNLYQFNLEQLKKMKGYDQNIKLPLNFPASHKRKRESGVNVSNKKTKIDSVNSQRYSPQQPTYSYNSQGYSTYPQSAYFFNAQRNTFQQQPPTYRFNSQNFTYNSVPQEEQQKAIPGNCYNENNLYNFNKSVDDLQKYKNLPIINELGKELKDFLLKIFEFNWNRDNDPILFFEEKMGLFDDEQILKWCKKNTIKLHPDKNHLNHEEISRAAFQVVSATLELFNKS